MSREPDKEHYSYAAYADPHMARTFDDRRSGFRCRFRTSLGLGGFAEDLLIEQANLGFEMLDLFFQLPFAILRSLVLSPPVG